MAMLRREGNLYLLDLGEGENRFTQDAVGELTEAIAEVRGANGERALVTLASGRFFSNGLDLDTLLSDTEAAPGYVRSVQALFADLLTLPAPSVAAVSGHAFAAGAMLALCHDARIMRADRGFVCLPEIDLGLPFTWGMTALLRARLAPGVSHEAMVTGRRYGGIDALAAGIVDEAVSEEEVLVRSLAIAEGLAPKAGPAMGTIKARLYADVVEQLTSAEAS
jgi:enoyl-CoA hydratase/carnithine racemase